jgi:hypothetical protein
MKSSAALAAALLTFSTLAARADDTEPEPTPPPVSEAIPVAAIAAPPISTSVTKTFGPKRWYGWQLAAADAPVWLAAWKAQPALMGLLGTGPIIHLLHGEDERAQASLAVRLVGSMFGAGISGLVLFDRECPADRTTCPAGMSTILKGAAIGLIVAELVDVAIIGWTSTADGDDALPPLVSRRSRERKVTPHGGLLVGDGNVVFSLSGAF